MATKMNFATVWLQLVKMFIQMEIVSVNFKKKQLSNGSILLTIEILNQWNSSNFLISISI